MKEMNKKYIIAVVLSIVMVSFLALASFAFLGSFKKVITNTNVNIIAQNVNNTYFNVTNNVSFALDVDPALMGEDNKNNYVTENTAVLDVSVNPAFDGMSVKCSYDIIFEYDSSSNVYGVSPTPVTTGADKELTLQISGPNGTSDYFEEKNFNLTSRKKTIVSGAEIINSISGMPTVHRWQFTNRFYNLDLDQTALANKSFKGRYYVVNVSCDRYEDNTIYSLIKNRYKNNDTYVKLYSESDASTYANPVYYFNGAVTNNNVLFAGFCWKMVRTTDTGGVKMVYNGALKDVVDSVPLSESEYTNLTNDETYSYTFDSTNKTWTSTNTGTNSSTISFSAPSSGDYVLNYDLSMYNYLSGIYVEIFKDNVSQGKFTGMTEGQILLNNLTTSNIIKVVFTRKNSYTSGNRNNVIFSLAKPTGDLIKSCNNSGKASQLASTKAFNSSHTSPAYVGYKHNTVYSVSSKALIYATSFSGSKIVGDSVTYTYNGLKYILNNTSTVSVSSSNISEMVGKYTCNSSSATSCSNPYYIVGYSGTTIYYYKLSDGNTNGASYSNKNYVFGKSFTFANGTYTLSDTVMLNSDTFISNATSVNTHHYTCLTDGTTCTSIYYIYNITSGGLSHYITLTNGKSVDDALNEMLYADDVNKTDSTIKAYIDTWYKDNMTSYTDKLEDTVFCNDRTMYNQSENGWNPNGGSTSNYLNFKNSSTNYSLACTNETDRFSMSNSKAKLTYPVGLLSAPEVWLAYRNASLSTYYLKTGNWFWLASPNYFDFGSTYSRFVDNSGRVLSTNVISTLGVRPVVSLKPGTGYTSGDGSYTNPFVVE